MFPPLLQLIVIYNIISLGRDIMTKKEEIEEKLKFYEKCRATMPDRLKTIDFEIDALVNKQVFMKKRRDKRVAELRLKRNELLKELADTENTLRSLYKELKELNGNN